MLFAQSIFQSVLDRLDAEDEETQTSDAQTAHRIRGLNTGFASTVMEGVSAASARPDQAYVDNLEFEEPQPAPETILNAEPQPEKPPEPEPPAEPLVMPPHLTRTAPQDVAAELAISARDTLQSLSDKRRAFARTNHPDGVPLPFRDNATMRMKIANLLIDEAMRRLSLRAKLSR